jgi:hypothetical protein
MRMDATVTVPDGMHRAPIATDLTQVSYSLTNGALALAYTRTPMRSDIVSSYTGVALAGGHGVVARMPATVEGDVAAGAVPVPLLDDVVAATAGALPDTMRVWAFNAESGAVLPADFRLRRRGSADVPLAKDGQRCTAETDVKRVARPTVTYRIRLGTEEEERTYLADRPHLAVGVDLKCVDLER